MSDDRFMLAAIEQAELGLKAGGIPIGAVLVMDDEVLFSGHNRRVQEGNPLLHAEMHCLQNAGRLTAETYRRCTLYSTLSPCEMCSGAALLYKIPRIVVGENQTFQGPEVYLRQRGVKLEIMNSSRCIQLMADFIRLNPALWNEDIGEAI